MLNIRTKLCIKKLGSFLVDAKRGKSRATEQINYRISLIHSILVIQNIRELLLLRHTTQEFIKLMK